MYQEKASTVSSLHHLTDRYLLVSRCWENHALAKKHKMSVEVAILILREIIASTLCRRPGVALAKRAKRLLAEIIRTQDSPKEAHIK